MAGLQKKCLPLGGSICIMTPAGASEEFQRAVRNSITRTAFGPRTWEGELIIYNLELAEEFSPAQARLISEVFFSRWNRRWGEQRGAILALEAAACLAAPRFRCAFFHHAARRSLSQVQKDWLLLLLSLPASSFTFIYFFSISAAPPRPKWLDIRQIIQFPNLPVSSDVANLSAVKHCRAAPQK